MPFKLTTHSRGAFRSVSAAEDAWPFLEKRRKWAARALLAAALWILVVVWIARFVTHRPSQPKSQRLHLCSTIDSEYLSTLEIRTVDGRPAYDIPLPGVR